MVFDENMLVKVKQWQYQEHVALNDGTMTGIKGNSCLNTLEYFYKTHNVGVDKMLDSTATHLQS